MAIIPILQYPDPRLQIKTEPVKDVNDPRLQKIIDDMFETLYATENCAGLAATQLAIENPPRVTVIDVSIDKSEPYCLINPEIISAAGEIQQPEACMSVYPEDIHAELKRAAKIKARALDRNGNVIEIEASGILAKCIQHEIDHLNGMVYIDRLSRLKRQLIDKKINKTIKNYRR